MKCPVCKDVDLLMSERQGVEIDYCPQCRGVWLDRGELDKIIERSAQVEPAPERPQAAGREERSRYGERGDAYRGGERHGDAYRQGERGHYPDRPKRRESFLGDLFDFD